MVEVLEMLSKKYVGDYAVTVMYDSDKHDQKTADYCQQNNWRYVDLYTMHGSEDQCVIITGGDKQMLEPEFITRGRNQLIMITSRG